MTTDLSGLLTFVFHWIWDPDTDEVKPCNPCSCPPEPPDEMDDNPPLSAQQNQSSVA